jgi:putative addiction module component (TIGR02574 family)
MSLLSIQNDILGLPPEERAKLIDFLWDSLASNGIKSREIAWTEEAERRINAFDAGKLEARDARQVLKDLKKSLQK